MVGILGPTSVRVGTQALDPQGWPGKAAQLLRLLAVAQNHRMGRDEAIELLWPEASPTAGISGLKTVLFRLRHHLQPTGLPSPIVLDRGWVMPNPDCSWEIDADLLLAADTEAQDDIDRLEQAALMWRGEPLLEDRYDDWAIPAREHLLRTWRRVSLRMVHLLQAAGEPKRAVAWAERLVEADPLDEEALRQLLGALVAAGRRLDARRTLGQFTTRIREELGVEPQAETRALLHVPTNLPIPATPIVGRRCELHVVTEMLSCVDVRLLTLTGVGGVGKTRLALEVAAQLTDRYEDGVYLVSLAPIADPRLVASGIAATLGVRVRGDQSVEAALATTIKDRRMLLVVDNCEHVLEGTLIAADLLSTCSGLNILATSRERLHLSAEHGYEVGPLARPDETTGMDDASSFDAVRLFVTRSVTAAPSFAMTQNNVSMVVQICQILDGLPLALELAAARVGGLSLHDILQHLTTSVMPRLSLLTEGFRDLPARQQTLRATIDWSYGLLTSEEQRVFCSLSAFAGGCTRQAAEAVCLQRGERTVDLEACLTSLVDKSLLRKEGSDEPRFAMLETIREYAAEQLSANRETERMRHLHAAYFLEFAEHAEPGGAQSELWLDRLGADLDNLRAGLAWYSDQGSIQSFMRLATALFLFWERRNHMQEGIAWLEEALTQEAEVPLPLRAAALRVQGVLVNRLGADFRRAQTLLEESLSAYIELGTDEEAIAGTLQNLGLALAEAGDRGKARPFLEESLARYRALNDTHGIGKLLNNVGRLEWQEGNGERARLLLSEGLTLSRRAGDKWMAGLNALALGSVLTEDGDHRGACPLLSEALLALRCTGDKWAFALALHVLGIAGLRQGEPFRAIRLFAASASLLNAIKMARFADAESEIALARSLTGKGECDAAWKEGYTMAPDVVAAYALEGLHWVGTL